MLRSIVGGIPRRGRAVWTTTLVATTTTAGGGSCYYYYYYYNNSSTTTTTSLEFTRTTLGIRRQAQFWRGVLPVVLDYYWNFGSSSPYVKYLEWSMKATPSQRNEKDSSSADDNQILAKNSQKKDDDFSNDLYQADKKRRMQELHERHAPEILRVLLNLKGLYIKLGQVLSVTALPLPEPYRVRFRTLQSNVPGHEDWATIERVLQRELGTEDLSTIFAFIEPVPQGAASIGQAHRAVLQKNKPNDNHRNDNYDEEDEEVIIKIQYPDASWQVPADIQCVGDFMKLCVYAGIIDESASRMSFDEFARQFTSELDYDAERRNLNETYQSTLLPNAPYRKRGVVVPHVYDELSTSKVITMSYLRGPKLEEEARRQLAALGIDTSRGIGQIVREAAARDDALDGVEEEAELMMSQRPQQQQQSWKVRWGQRVGQWIGVDRALAAVRIVQRVRLWTTALSASMVRLLPMMPEQWRDWSEQHVTAYQQAQRLDVTKKWIDALFDVHGYQIFQQGLFNADCHPGNILVLEDENGQMTTKLGLIDYGQCKRLTPIEQVRVAELLLSVANHESDEQVATAFRRMHVQTKNDSTEFLAEMARLMFGRFETMHLDHAYHRKLHEMDRITYFPKELSMVYRTSLLLRGLAVSLQNNPSVSEHWRIHAQAALEQHGGALVQEAQLPSTTQRRSSFVGDHESSLAGEVAVAG